LYHETHPFTETPVAGKPPIRILIAEDHLIARVGLSAIVNAHPDMTVIAEAINGEQAVMLHRTHRPHVTLMDMRMPAINGFEAVVAIRAEFPDARIIALSTFGGDEDVRRAILAGARAYLTKDVLHDELIAAIRAVHAGQQYLPTFAAAAVAKQTLHPDLSVRELEVLHLITQGSSNKQIAQELGIADDTAKNHVKSILRKLGAGDRTQAATEAIRRGIIHVRE
jgi:two-component system, NarL family, response regulator